MSRRGLSGPRVLSLSLWADSGLATAGSVSLGSGSGSHGQARQHPVTHVFFLSSRLLGYFVSSLTPPPRLPRCLATSSSRSRPLYLPTPTPPLIREKCPVPSGRETSLEWMEDGPGLVGKGK